eukprot:TRINITY_DN2508_c0_g1_i1.p1 TRINITY_DN2508_c0_g1~~TRINITY_DN2508_c0_g1_i1.p1  ORF type:complete len:433 (+),score=64.18 TRINITY_DN2508_c0_g1_i1:71-1300(+)
MVASSASAPFSATGSYVPQYPKADAAAAVMQILTAQDHYAALNASETDSISALRRRYLRASFSVHPDKSSHSGATEAFKRVTVAWNVLNDETKRRKYDSDLPRLRAMGGLWPGACDSHDFISQEDACSAFARAQEEEEEETRGDDNPAGTSSESPSARAAFEALATSAGFWATGHVFDSLGMTSIGAVAQRFAMAKATAHLIMAAQNPTVQQSIKSAADVVGHSAGDVSASARVALSDAMESATQIADSARQAVGHLDCCVQQRQRVREDGIGRASKARDSVERETKATPAEPMKGEDRQAQTNSSVQESKTRRDEQRKPLVRIVGLKTAQHLNGRLGRIIGVMDCGRMQVRLEPVMQSSSRTASSSERFDGVEHDARTSVKLVRPENLEDPAAATCSTQPPCDSFNFM